MCEKCVDRSEVREAMTKQLNDSLNQCAQNLQDEKVFAKLSVGEAVQTLCWLFDYIIQPRKVLYNIVH
jgi:hypothetical protein